MNKQNKMQQVVIFKVLFLLNQNTLQVQLLVLESSVFKLCSPNYSSVLVLNAQRIFFLSIRDIFFMSLAFWVLSSLQ